MTSLSSTIKNEYENNFPKDLPIKTAQSFIATGVIFLISGGTAVVALLGGGIAALASTIEAFTRPIMTSIFPKNPFIKRIIQISICESAMASLAELTFPWLGLAYEVSSLVVVSLITWIALNRDYFEKNTAMAAVL